jgi:hypothetical protein
MCVHLLIHSFIHSVTFTWALRAREGLEPSLAEMQQVGFLGGRVASGSAGPGGRATLLVKSAT